MNENENIRRGDRVRIEGVYFPHRGNYIGRTGTVDTIDGVDGSYYVLVDGDTSGAQINATRVTRLREPTVAEPTPESVLPAANLQAATFAHQLLGNDADLDKLIGVAEFVMDRRTLGTETTGTVSIDAAKATPEDKLIITDTDGDRAEFAAGEWDNPDGVNVTVYNDGDEATAYLTKDDLARVVAFLDGHRRTFTASA